jgi:ion channel
MSEETRRDIVVIVIFSLVSAIGMTSAFCGCRFLAWIAIVISDFYLFAVLLLAALRSDDDGFLDRHSWITGFFPRKAAGILVVTLLFLSVLSGFAGLYVGVEVFPSGKTPLDALYISFFTLGFTDYSPAPGYGQLVVIAQLVSGVLLLAALFPIHISRISTFKNP